MGRFLPYIIVKRYKAFYIYLSLSLCSKIHSNVTLSGCLAYMLIRSCDRGTYNRTLFLAVVSLLFRAEGFRELKLSDAGRYHERVRE